jgi:hypothetical protein
VVKTLRDQILADVEKNGTDAEKRFVRALIEDGDTRGLLTLVLKLAQR